MTCEKNIAKITDFLAGELPSAEKQTLTAHFATCQRCGPEFDKVSGVWKDLGQLDAPEPGPNLSKQFYAMLEGYAHGSAEPDVTPLPRHRGKTSQIIVQCLAAAALLVFGFFLGRKPSSTTPADLNPPWSNTSLAWFTDPSAAARLQGVSNLTQHAAPSRPEVFAILLSVLETDASEDVRLAVLRALRPFRDLPQIRKGLIRTLPNQTAPLVQIEIMDCLVQTNDLNTTQTLESLLQREPLHPNVKQRAQELLLEIR